MSVRSFFRKLLAGLGYVAASLVWAVVATPWLLRRAHSSIRPIPALRPTPRQPAQGVGLPPEPAPDTVLRDAWSLELADGDGSYPWGAR